MDGNGRWARSHGLPRVAGHREGAKAVRRVIEAAPDLDIGTLTLYAFSSDNWRRPPAERPARRTRGHDAGVEIVGQEIQHLVQSVGQHAQAERDGTVQAAAGQQRPEPGRPVRRQLLPHGAALGLTEVPL